MRVPRAARNLRAELIAERFDVQTIGPRLADISQLVPSARGPDRASGCLDVRPVNHRIRKGISHEFIGPRALVFTTDDAIARASQRCSIRVVGSSFSIWSAREDLAAAGPYMLAAETMAMPSAMNFMKIDRKLF